MPRCPPDGCGDRRGLVKHYGPVKALDGLTLRAPACTALGVLGPNGAGKTTAVRVLTTLLRPDAGRAEVAGVDVLADPAQVLLEQFDLGDAGDRPSKTYSGGMRRRLDLAGALVARPRCSSGGRAHHRPRPPQPRCHVGRDHRPGLGRHGRPHRGGAAAGRRPDRLQDIGIRRTTLDDAFLALTGHGASEDPGPTQEPVLTGKETR